MSALVTDEPLVIDNLEEFRDVGDPKSVKASIKSSKDAANIRKETLRTFMSTEDGRRFFFEILSNCGIYRNPFSADPHRTAFACGEMNIGQQILIAVENADPKLYLLMLEENRG